MSNTTLRLLGFKEFKNSEGIMPKQSKITGRNGEHNSRLSAASTITYNVQGLIVVKPKSYFTITNRLK